MSSQIAEWISISEAHLEEGSISPIEYQLVEGTGWGAVIDGIMKLKTEKTGKELAVRIVGE